MSSETTSMNKPSPDTTMLSGPVLYKNVVENIHHGVYVLDRDMTIRYWNSGAMKITGYCPDDVIGMRCIQSILKHTDSNGKCLCQNNQCPAKKALFEGAVVSEEMYLKHKDGYRVPIMAHVNPIRDDAGIIIGAVETFSDNSSFVAARRKIEELENIALLDPLTGIGNRKYAELNLQAKTDAFKRYGWGFGILFIDVDNFKKCNDLYGHVTGDKLLKIIARTILNGTRSFDTTCRWGGDEFLVILSNVSEKELLGVARRICALVEESTVDEMKTLQTGVSIGATLARDDDTIDALIKRADERMYRSKNAGGSRVTM
jgi:diguanylate cyclase (GGDEF)-like protein/PAS domain S-box-containing protein